MNRKQLLIACAAAIVAVALAGIFFLDTDTPMLNPETAAKQPAPTETPSIVSNQFTPEFVAPSPAIIEPTDSEDPTAHFHVDASGNLVLNENARLHIEALVALNDARTLEAKVQDEVLPMPPAAAAKVHELVERYVTYMHAQLAAYPPGHAPPDVDAMLEEINGLHALRVAHFGEQTAEAFFGEEEQLNRELLELMRLEKDPGLSMEEKAERAQAKRTELRRVEAIERKNVEAAKRAQQEQAKQE